MSFSNPPENKREVSGGEPTMSGSNRTAQQIASEQRLKSTQAKVDEVVGIMHDNVEKLIQRDENLVELKDRSDKLEVGALKFKEKAATVRHKFFLENRKDDFVSESSSELSQTNQSQQQIRRMASISLKHFLLATIVLVFMVAFAEGQRGAACNVLCGNIYGRARRPPRPSDYYCPPNADAYTRHLCDLGLYRPSFGGSHYSKK
ncbi:unnamed protein product [Orchesella dallaii]|uniref:V-SNARE coiled-coil homology domain-containing protein n=1 Tax=Orchesella dallaii TaxID=48710 RepID=A0ABP1RLY4_9HEXA